MNLEKARQDTALLWIAILAAATIQISIAVSQTLLGIGIGMMLVFRRRFSFSSIGLPLLVFFGITLLSLLASVDPWGGRAQIRKFYVFFLIPLLYEAVRERLEAVNWVLAGWVAAATASGVWGLVQFYGKYHRAQSTGADFYTAYVASRITGFESHWMTFGALQLGTLLLLTAHLFFAKRRFPWWVYSAIAVLGAAIVLGWTRSIWLAAIPSLLYLFWVWKPKFVWILPVLLIFVIVFAPGDTTERITSLFNPHGDTDSNQHRLVTFATGWQMVKAHPLLGLGPEQVGKQFLTYVPPSIARPLPVGYYGHLHNIYLQYAAERGVFALITMLWLIGTVVWRCASALRSLALDAGTSRFLLHGAIAFILAILTEGLFEFNLGDSEVLMFFVSVLGLSLAVSDCAQVKSASPSLPSAS